MIARLLRIGFAIFGMVATLSAHALLVVETSTLQLQFDDAGQLSAAVACHPECADPGARRKRLSRTAELAGFVTGTNGRWSVQAFDERRDRVLEFTGPDGRSVRWTIPQHGYGLGLATKGMGDLRLQSGDALQPHPAAGFGDWLERARYVLLDADGVEQIALDETSVGPMRAEWAGYRNRFWAVLISADRESEFELATAAGRGEPVLVRPAAGEPERMLLYLGPVEPRELAAVDPLLRDVMYAGLWFWLRWICLGLFYLLAWLQQVVPVWGLAIMLLSAAVAVLMAPLSRAAGRLQEQVHATEARLAPELGRIKRQFRGEEQAAKIIALYRMERVHPLYSLKSLLGVAILIPVFIGAFDMLAENIHLLDTPFLWVDDLSRPDAFAGLPFRLPFFGDQLNLLPFLMTCLSILASALHRPLAQHPDLRRRQLRNMIALAVVFFALFYTFPAGMVLYWTTNNLIAVGKGLWVRLSRSAAFT